MVGVLDGVSESLLNNVEGKLGLKITATGTRLCEWDYSGPVDLVAALARVSVTPAIQPISRLLGGVGAHLRLDIRGQVTQPIHQRIGVEGSPLLLDNLLLLHDSFLLEGHVRPPNPDDSKRACLLFYFFNYCRQWAS
jgi:hypothetical protein